MTTKDSKVNLSMFSIPATAFSTASPQKSPKKSPSQRAVNFGSSPGTSEAQQQQLRERAVQRTTISLWYRTSKNLNVRDGPLVHSFACLLEPLFRLLCPAHSYAHSLSHCQTRGKVSDLCWDIKLFSTIVHLYLLGDDFFLLQKMMT